MVFDCVEAWFDRYKKRLKYIYRSDVTFRNNPAINNNLILRSMLCYSYVGWIIVSGSIFALLTAIMMQLPAHFCIETTKIKIPCHQIHKGQMNLTWVYFILALVTPFLMHLLRDWYERCQDGELIEFTDELQQVILDAHNKLRNQLALGQTPGYESAKRMATMVWDDELAKLSKYNTVQCKMEHDKCHSTRVFYVSGQNLAEHGDTDNEKLVEWAPGFWFEEYPRANMDDIRVQGRLQDENGKYLGHFTQVVKDDSYKIGCSMSKFTNQNGARKALIACNYAVGNVDGYPIYVDGETAADCKTGTNPDFPGLCSVDEIYEGPFFRPDY